MALELNLKKDAMWDAVSLGEIMLRLDPGDERIRVARNFRVWEGGGEYNVVRGLRKCFGMKTTVLVETMAGKGTEIGRTFDELARMYDGVGDASRLGVCLDTCHIWDGGYDVAEHLDDVIGAFDAAVGIEHLRAIHLNDSMNALGAHKDRHARIGEGHIGFEALLRVVKHPKLAGLPFILETPNDIDGYRREIAMFRARN